MLIKDLFNEKKVVYSFEIFPPKATSPVETVYKTLEGLSDLQPDYISVTYGAGGNLSDNRTCELSSIVKNKYGTEATAHLTCISSSKEEVKIMLERLKDNNIENILALRGDVPIDQGLSKDFKYAEELINFIKENGNFGIAAACYPEGHPECHSIDLDVKNLKRKVDAGCDFLISQLFFDNNLFYNFKERCYKENINVPIEAGIMPVVNKKQIERITSLCGASIPDKFLKIMNKYEHDKEALRDAGIAYAVEQIVDLVSSDVSGIHLYTMNNPYVARRITESTSSILKNINNERKLQEV